MKYNARVGFSVNPELELAVRDTPGSKKVLERMDFCLSGSSGNVAMAIKRLGGCPHLLGLVAARHEETLACKLLDEAVRQNKMPFTPIRVLAQTNVCVIPVIGEANGVLWGKRNKIVHSEVPKALQKLAKQEIGISPNIFTVITGLRSVEIAFAKTLLTRTQAGFRVLNAKDTLCGARREFKKILPLVDLLVLNHREFDEIGMTLSRLHSHGPRIVVVTHGESGGMFHFHSGQNMFLFNPVSFLGGKFETGAGDWFLGALVSELIRLRESVFTVKPEQFQRAIDFAARVAGKKITIPGGGNGPTRSQLRN